jgi:hypothetical protein
MVKRVDVAGGVPLKISETPGLARGGAWTSDGRILFGSFDSGLFQVLATGGNPSKVTKAEALGDAWHRWPQLLPGGFLYQARSDKSGASGVFAASWAKPEEPVRLLDIDSGALYAEAGGQGYLLWLRGPTLVGQAFDPAALKFSGEPHPVADPVAGGITSLGQPAATAGSGVLAYSASSPSSQFNWMDRTGKRLGALGDLSEYAMSRLSPDGHRVAALRYTSGGLDLWMLDVARGVASLFPAGSKVSYPVWSPDGKTVVFRYGNSNLFRKGASGVGSEERLTQSPNIQSSTDWSRDGRWILYHETAPGTGQDLWVLPVTSEGRVAPGSAPKPYVQTKANELRGRFSPESPPKWVAYESDETGNSEIYVQSFPEPRGKIRISTNGGRYPQWGVDSGELFYVSLDGELMAVNLRSGADSLEPSAPRELFPLPAMEMGWSPYEVTPDGQRFLVRATPGRAGAPLTVIVNWPALLKKESPAP